MCQDISASIIIPAWNEAKIIQETLEYLTNIRIETPTEVIIVAGGGDNTYKLCREWSENDHCKFDKCICLRQNPEEGKIGALQKGYTNSHGDYLILLDADTLVPENWLVRIIEELHHYDAVSCNYEPKRTGRIATAQPLINKWAALGREQKFLRGGASIGIRRNVIQEIGAEHIFPQGDTIPADDIYLNIALNANDKDIGPLIRDVTVKTHFPPTVFQLYRIKARWNSIQYDLSKGNRRNIIKTFLSSSFVFIFPFNVVFSFTAVTLQYRIVLILTLIVLIPSSIFTIMFFKERLQTIYYALQESADAWYWLPQYIFIEYLINIVIIMVYLRRFVGNDNTIRQFKEERKH